MVKQKGWKGESHRHRLAGMGISTRSRGCKPSRMNASGMEDDIIEQIMKGKFPINVKVDKAIIDENEWQIKEWAEGDADEEAYIRKKISKVKIGITDFKEMTGIEDDWQSLKEDAKDSYKWYKDEAKEDGWLDEVEPFKEWFHGEYGHDATLKGYIANLEDYEAQEYAEILIESIKEDLWEYVGL